MSAPSFFAFRSPGVRGYPEIGFMQTQRLAGPDGDCPKATDRVMTAYFEAAVRGEEPTLNSIVLDTFICSTEEKGTKWPDVMGHGQAGYEFILSERVMEAMEREGITGYEQKPVVFDNIRNKKLREIAPPTYFAIKPTGGIDILKKYYSKTEEGFEYVGEVTNGEDRTYQKVRHAQFYPLPDTWDGSDWFLMRNHGHFRHFGCSRKLMELAFREKWTNCKITPMDAVIGDRRLDWPLTSTGKLPELWYSDQHPGN